MKRAPPRRSAHGERAPTAGRSRITATRVTLRLKLAVLIAGVIVFAMSGVTAVALWRELVRGQELLAREGVAIASTAANPASQWVGQDGGLPGADRALAPVMERVLATAPLDRAWVVDGRGKVLACASRTGERCPEGVAPSEFQSADWPLQTLARLILSLIHI